MNGGRGYWIKMKKPKFTTWEKFQFAYVERKLKIELSDEEKCALILRMGWRNKK